MTSMEVMDPLEANSKDLHPPPEVVINQVSESEKVINSRSWKYLNYLFLDVIKYSEGGTQEITTPQKEALWKSIRWGQEHRYLTAS